MNDSLESQLFKWQYRYKYPHSWLFRECTIVQPFGPFKKDEHVAWIELDYGQLRIVCENGAGARIYEGRLVLGVE